ALELVIEPDERAEALFVRAACEQKLGDLPSAERDYRAAGGVARDPVNQALARYGLGVTLEREGDVPASNAALESGCLLRWPFSTSRTDDPLDLPVLVFFPRYERLYLTALVAMTRARHEDEPQARRVAYEEAVEEWDAYLLAADPREPWLEHARRHR